VTDSWVCGKPLLVEGEVQTMDVDAVMADVADIGVLLRAGIEEDEANAASTGVDDTAEEGGAEDDDASASGGG